MYTANPAMDSTTTTTNTAASTRSTLQTLPFLLIFLYIDELRGVLSCHNTHEEPPLHDEDEGTLLS